MKRINSYFCRKLIRMIGRTNNILVKMFITTFCPNLFFKVFYGYAQNLKCLHSACVTLSFDCDHTLDVKALPKLIELLCSYDLKASFACVGKLIEKFPKEHLTIVENGHEIINHTYTHPFNEELKSFKKFNKLTIDEQKLEIIQCHQVCRDVLDYEPIGFRMPHFGIQYTDTIYDILSEIGYAYSSSILGVKSPTFGIPYIVKGIIEFPVITCPKHPFQAYDTYHAFRSRITSHGKDDFYEVFKTLIEFGIKNNIYINIYFDPQDVIKLNFEKFLEYLKCQKVSVKTYRDIVREIKRQVKR